MTPLTKIPPVPPIPAQFTATPPPSTTTTPLTSSNSKSRIEKEYERPNFRSLSYSKPTILKFEEFPNINLAFYLDLVSPNDVANLADSVVVSPRLEMVRSGRERELNSEKKGYRGKMQDGSREKERDRDKRVDSGVLMDDDDVKEHVKIREDPEMREKGDVEDERLERANSDQARYQQQQNHILRDESLANFDQAQLQQQQNRILTEERLASSHQAQNQQQQDRVLTDERLPNLDQADVQVQRQQQDHVLKDERLQNANLDQAQLNQHQKRASNQQVFNDSENMDFSTSKKSLPFVGREQVTIFNLKGWEPDTKITVFGKESRVHSVVLKLYSAFFRTALNAIDAGSGPSAANRFRYDFESVEIGQTGNEFGWTLQKAVEKPRTPSPSPGLPPKEFLSSTAKPEMSPQDQEIVAFTNLLHAYYNKPYALTSIDSLTTLVRLATNFESLPCVSSSLYTTLWDSPLFIPCIQESPERVLLLATKLRHKLLFKEAFVHVVAHWQGWHDVFDGEYRLVCTITKARNELLERLMGTNRRVFEILGREDGFEEEDNRPAILEVLKENYGEYQSRRFYERLWELTTVKNMGELKAALKGLSRKLEALVPCWQGETVPQS